MGSSRTFRITSLMVCIQLWVLATGELNDRVGRVFWGTAGEGNSAIDPDAITHDGEPNLLMITKVTIGYFDYQGTKDIRCIVFSYGDEEKACETPMASQIDDYILDRDEYLIEVSGTQSVNINKITLKTNKRTIGPYGQVAAPDQFVASNNGAPLLYVKMVYGILTVYEMSFTFHKTTVADLTDITNQVATETYTVLTSTITDIFEVQGNYAHMLFDVGRKGCYAFDVEQTPEALTACNLKTILSQVGILASSTTSHQQHSTRNLVQYANYDSKEFVSQVSEAKQFHKLLTQLEFDLQTVIDVTDQQSEDLNNYFSKQAALDEEIAEQDILYLEGQLDRCKTGAADASSAVGKRLTNIIDVGLSMMVELATEEFFKLGIVMAENCNPFKWLFGGPEIEDIMDAAQDFMDAVRNIATMSYLVAHVSDYMQLSEDIANKFADNAEQIAAMNELVNQFYVANDTDTILALSEDYVQAYGAYSPQVTEQDIAHLSALLTAVGDEACGIIADSGGIVGDLTATVYESCTQDCLLLPADQASLDSYYEDTYSFQFELVDALTEVVKYSVAKHLAGDIGKVEKTIDVQFATIGTCMLEISYQAASQARCDILEYVNAGKRADVCKNLLFTDEEIISLISYKSTLPKSDTDSYAYFPTSNQHQADVPFIDFDKLLRGGKQTIRPPYNNTEWLIEYGWLPGHSDPETAYYYEILEPFIPGLKCNETDQPNAVVYMEMVSAKPQLLYKEETETVSTIFQQKVKFSYETDTSPCPGKYVSYPVVRNDTTNFVADKEIEVCVTSEGALWRDDRDDFMLPSLYSQWNLTIYSDPWCTLVFDPDFDFYPMVTFKLRMMEVSIKAAETDPGIDECWPEGSRCEESEWCVDEELGYHCQASSIFFTKLIEDLLETIKAGIFQLVNLLG